MTCTKPMFVVHLDDDVGDDDERRRRKLDVVGQTTTSVERGAALLRRSRPTKRPVAKQWSDWTVDDVALWLREQLQVM